MDVLTLTLGQVLSSVQSPLSMAMDEPVLHRFIAYLAEKKAELERDPAQHIKIELQHELVASVRHSFRQNILAGEKHLHILAHMLASHLFDGEFELHSNVIGTLPDGNRPFLIRERITRETLFSQPDLDLGNHLLDNFRYQKDRAWLPLELSANFVEYIPRTTLPLQNTSGVNRITSRVKAEEELWNKVTDELFRVDELVSRDKHFRQYSKYVKDIFGVKIVCDDEPMCIRVHERLKSIKADDPLCRSWLPDSSPDQKACSIANHNRLLEFVEVKDYLTCSPEKMKKTGWRALKSVVKWNDRLFELQVQPLANYYLELDHMAGPSHSSFKSARDRMREDLARQYPLYGFYRQLLKMLFLGTESAFNCENASVAIV